MKTPDIDQKSKSMIDRESVIMRNGIDGEPRCQCADRVYKLPESSALTEVDAFCPNRPYRRRDGTLLPLCKAHFLRFMRNFLRK